MINIVLIVLFLVAIGITNGAIAKQLEYTKYTNEELGKKWKGIWHTFMGLLRLIFAISLIPISIGYFLLYVLLDFTFYDAIIDKTRGRSFCKLTATCEHWGSGFDWDCISLWTQDKTHIPYTCFKMTLAVLIILLYFITF